MAGFGLITLLWYIRAVYIIWKVFNRVNIILMPITAVESMYRVSKNVPVRLQGPG
jgi:hypothetical protein